MACIQEAKRENPWDVEDWGVHLEHPHFFFFIILLIGYCLDIHFQKNFSNSSGEDSSSIWKVIKQLPPR